MNRGEIYRVAKPPGDDPKKQRYFVVVGRSAVIESRFSSVICAPIYSVHDGLSTQVLVGINEGLQRDSSIHCDALVSIVKAQLTHYTGSLSSAKIEALNRALAIALDLET